MRILVADKFPDSGLVYLTEKGHEVQYKPDLTGADLAGALGGVEVLVVRSTNVPAAAIEAGDLLALIVRAGAGTNTIDKRAAADSAVYVANVPGRNAIAVAELTLGLILAIDRWIPDNVIHLRAESWRKSIYSKGQGLFGRSLGIVGLGAIGMAVASRAAAFGLTLHGLERARSAAATEQIAGMDFTLHPDLKSLAGAVDIISLQVPAAAETKHLVDADFLAALRPGTVLINTSRADVVDEEALLAAIDDKDLWVGADVFENEPSTGEGDFASALAKHPRVYGTHHIGASTAQAQAAVATGVLEVIDAFAAGTALNSVNILPSVPEATSVTIRHHNRVGVLAAILTLIRDSGINVEHMSNLIFDGSQAATATLDLTGDVSDELLGRLMAIPDVIHARVNA